VCSVGAAAAEHRASTESCCHNPRATAVDVRVGVQPASFMLQDSASSAALHAYTVCLRHRRPPPAKNATTPRLLVDIDYTPVLRCIDGSSHDYCDGYSPQDCPEGVSTLPLRCASEQGG